MNKSHFLLSPRSLFYLLPLLLLFVFSGCQQESLPGPDGLTNSAAAKAHRNEMRINTYYGPAQPFNGGVVRAMVSMNEDGEPTQVGVKISAKVLEEVEALESEVLTLQFPNKAAGLPFNHVDLNWNMHGHEPDFLYAVPHFDAHFYMVSEEYKMGITDLEKAADYPDPQYVPEGYQPPPPFLPVQLVPQMGVHWTKITEAPPFTHTFIFGSYDDEFIFYEPMFTVAYLRNGADGELFPIAEPDVYQHPGYYYPTNYSLDYDEVKKEYTIILGGMKWVE